VLEWSCLGPHGGGEAWAELGGSRLGSPEVGIWGAVYSRGGIGLARPGAGRGRGQLEEVEGGHVLAEGRLATMRWQCSSMPQPGGTLGGHLPTLISTAHPRQAIARAAVTQRETGSEQMDGDTPGPLRADVGAGERRRSVSASVSDATTIATLCARTIQGGQRGCLRRFLRRPH